MSLATAALSWSECRRYMGCPLAWRLSRRQEPEALVSGFVFSAAFRAVMSGYCRARQEGRAVSAGELLDVYDRRWAEEVGGGLSGSRPTAIRYSSTDGDAANLRALAERMVEAFLASRGEAEIVAVEKAFQVTLAPDLPPVTGRVDLMEIRRDADGVWRLHLVAWKTASRRPAPLDLDTDRLVLFGEAVRQLGLADAFKLPLAFRYDVISKTRKPESLSIPVEPLPNAVARLTETARHCWRGMEAGICYPNSSWRCSGCGHAQACAGWPTTSASISVTPALPEAIPA